MLGVQIEQKNRFSWSTWAFLLACASAAFGIWIGPGAMALAALIGAVVAGLGAIVAFSRSLFTDRRAIALTALGVNGALLLIAVLLHRMFLSPLSNENLRMPYLSEPVQFPEEMFTVKGPQNWTWTPLVSAYETGVSFQPAGREGYIGVLEAKVLVRKAPIPPTRNPSELLEKLAVATPDREPVGRRIFNMTTEPAQLLRGGRGHWSVLSAKKFWIPVEQVTLFGIKDGRYLCSVSVTGFQKHNTLFRVLALGLFEAVQPIRQAPSGAQKSRE